MSLEEQIAEVLVSIENAKTRFQPESDSDADLREFQSTGQALEEAHRRGYIEALIRKSLVRDKLGLILDVRIAGPVTYRGRKFLEDLESSDKEKHESLWILEPNIYGFGIRLRQLLHRLKVWRNKRNA